MVIAEAKHYETAFKSYLPRLAELIANFDSPRILELGGGRRPSYRLDDLPSNVSSYTVNDIDPEELALVPSEYKTAAFDVTSDAHQFAGEFDVVFSRTLMEHVSDGEAMHRNVLSLLKPGGVAFHMCPTLYAPPFVLNLLLPERMSRAVLFAFRPWRRTEKPKFPAYYSWCYGDEKKMAKMLCGIGYSEAKISTFYGHGYFEPIPILREIDSAFSAMAARNDWTTFASFAHVTARK